MGHLSARDSMKGNLNEAPLLGIPKYMLCKARK